MKVQKKSRDKNDWLNTNEYGAATCKVCEKCFVHLRSGRCVFGGPFIGYVGVK